MGYSSHGRSSRGVVSAIVVMIMAAIFAFISYGLGMSSLTEGVASNAAKGSGLSDIQVGPAQPNFLYFQCGEGDTAHREVTGVNAQGERVSIVVCGGWLKAATVRYT